MTEPSPYIKKLLAALDASPESFPRGAVGRADVLHEDWCPFLSGDGPCSCDPEIRIDMRSDN